MTNSTFSNPSSTIHTPIKTNTYSGADSVPKNTANQNFPSTFTKTNGNVGIAEKAGMMLPISFTDSEQQNNRTIGPIFRSLFVEKKSRQPQSSSCQKNSFRYGTKLDKHDFKNHCNICCKSVVCRQTKFSSMELDVVWKANIETEPSFHLMTNMPI